MRMAVKPHQAFFLAAQTDYAAGLVPVLGRVPALFPSPHPHAARLAVRPRRKRSPSAGVRLRPGARPERPSSAAAAALSDSGWFGAWTTPSPGFRVLGFQGRPP